MDKNLFCNILGIKYPIIQGAMACIADGSLASAVSEAGGLGIIAAGSSDAEYLRREIIYAKSKTKKPFGVNIMLLSPHAEDIAHMICEEGVRVVTTGAGNPGKYIKLWKQHGIKVIPVVASVALAKRMERSGADVIIAEGSEAGGHIGETTTMALIPQIVDEVSIPVIAAGGIGDNRSVAAAFMLGAEAVQVGTRFLVAKECTVNQNYKDKIINAKDIDTVVTGRSMGHPVRVIKNKLARKMMLLEKQNASIDKLNELGKGALYKAAKEGDMDNGSIMAGQIAGLVKKEQTCEEIIKEMLNVTDILEKVWQDGRLNYGE